MSPARSWRSMDSYGNDLKHVTYPDGRAFKGRSSNEILRGLITLAANDLLPNGSTGRR